MSENQQETTMVVAPKQAKNKPIKTLPTDRLGFEKQLGVLRGYAATSGSEKKAVSNKQISDTVSIHGGTISNCNPFFNEVGLLIKEGAKYKPAEEVFDYASSYEWDADKAALKLAPLLSRTWFAAILFPKLAFRTLTKDEAIGFLADEAKASKEYKAQLEMLLDYLKVAGLINIDGNSLSQANKTKPNDAPAAEVAASNNPNTLVGKKVAVDSETIDFSIPIPGMPSATITVPKALTADDWTMIKTMLDAYINRLQKKSGAASTGEDLL